MTTVVKKKNSHTRMVSRIWSLARDLGIDGDNKDMLYYMMQGLTGYGSISRLCQDDSTKAKQFIFHMQGMLIKKKRPGHAGKKGMIVPLPTQAQLKHVSKLETAITSTGSGIRAEHIANRTWKKPVKRLNYFQTQGLIEALKSISRRVK